MSDTNEILPIEIQQCDISERDFETDAEADKDDRNYYSDNWTTLFSYANFEDALCGLVRAVNDDELDEANNYFRVRNRRTKTVLQ